MRTITARVATKFLKKASQDLEIHIYDFDGTLFRSPDAPEWWSRKRYGQWHSNQSSLGQPFIANRPSSDYWIRSVVREAKASISDMSTWAVMCTGRIDSGPLRYRVAELLDQVGLDFDQNFLNYTGGETEPYKQKVLIDLLKQHPQVKKVVMWEDTQKNLDALEKICVRANIEFEGHLISEILLPADHISEDEYIDFLRGELPAKEFDKIYKALLKSRKRKQNL